MWHWTKFIICIPLFPIIIVVVGTAQAMGYGESDSGEYAPSVVEDDL